MSAKITTKSTYVIVWLLLMMLLILTWGVAKFDLGVANTIAALAIAVAKMVLVLLFFMHLRYNSRLTWLFAAAGLVWLLIMITLTLTDYLTREPVKPYDKDISTWHEKLGPSGDLKGRMQHENSNIETHGTKKN